MPESVGKTLKRIRESRQLTLEEVSEKSHIPKKILSAIEEDRLHEIHSVFYARGFVKSYSQLLDALEEKTIREYLGSAQKKDKPILVLEGEKVPGDWFIKYKRHIGIGILVVAAVWAAFFSFRQMRKFVKNVSARHQAYIAKKQERAKTSMESKEVVRTLRPQDAATTQPEQIEGVKLEIIARSDTWIQVISDGKLLFRGILKKREKDVWLAKRDIELELGNAGGVALKLNGEDLAPLGKRGEKKKVIITEDGVKK